MKKLSLHGFLLLLCWLPWVSGWAGDAIVVSQAWARATPPGSQVGAVYLRIENGGHTSAEFVSVSTPVAKKAEFHKVVMDGEVMKMQALPSVVVPMHGVVEFAPGGEHIMLMGLSAPLVDGEQFELMLSMADGSVLRVEVMIATTMPAYQLDDPMSTGTMEHDHSE